MPRESEWDGYNDTSSTGTGRGSGRNDDSIGKQDKKKKKKKKNQNQQQGQHQQQQRPRRNRGTNDDRVGSGSSGPSAAQRRRAAAAAAAAIRRAALEARADAIARSTRRWQKSITETPSNVGTSLASQRVNEIRQAAAANAAQQRIKIAEAQKAAQVAQQQLQATSDAKERAIQEGNLRAARAASMNAYAEMMKKQEEAKRHEAWTAAIEERRAAIATLTGGKRQPTVALKPRKPVAKAPTQGSYGNWTPTSTMAPAKPAVKPEETKPKTVGQGVSARVKKYDKKDNHTGRELEKELTLLDETQKVSSGNDFDVQAFNDTVTAYSEYADGVARRLEKKLARLDTLEKAWSDAKTPAEKNAAARAYNRLAGSSDFKGDVAEYKRLYGDGRKKKGTVTRFVSQAEAMAIEQNKFLDRQYYGGSLIVALRDASYQQELAKIDESRGWVTETGANGQPVRRQRTLQEEIAFRNQQQTEREKQSQHVSADIISQKVTEIQNDDAARAVNGALQARGLTTDDIRGADWENRANGIAKDLVKDWELKNPNPVANINNQLHSGLPDQIPYKTADGRYDLMQRPAGMSDKEWGDRVTYLYQKGLLDEQQYQDFMNSGKIAQDEGLKKTANWEKRRQDYEDRVRKYLDTPDPGLLGDVFQAPVVEGAINMAASIWGQFGVGMRRSAAQEGGEPSLVGGNPQVTGPFGLPLNAGMPGLYPSVDKSPEAAGRAAEFEKRLKEVEATGDAWAYLRFLGTEGQEPFRSGRSAWLANTFGQVVVDPTNVIPLNPLSYLKRASAAAEAAGRVASKGDSILARVARLGQQGATGFHSFMTVSEDFLRARDNLSRIAAEAGGVRPSVMKARLGEALAGLDDVSDRADATRRIFAALGLTEQQIDGTQIANLVEQAINAKLLHDSKHIVTRADEIAKEVADRKAKEAVNIAKRKARADAAKEREAIRVATVEAEIKHAEDALKTVREEIADKLSERAAEITRMVRKGEIDAAEKASKDLKAAVDEAAAEVYDDAADKAASEARIEAARKRAEDAAAEARAKEVAEAKAKAAEAKTAREEAQTPAEKRVKAKPKKPKKATPAEVHETKVVEQLSGEPGVRPAPKPVERRVPEPLIHKAPSRKPVAPAERAAAGAELAKATKMLNEAKRLHAAVGASEQTANMIAFATKKVKEAREKVESLKTDLEWEEEIPAVRDSTQKPAYTLVPGNDDVGSLDLNVRALERDAIQQMRTQAPSPAVVDGFEFMWIPGSLQKNGAEVAELERQMLHGTREEAINAQQRMAQIVHDERQSAFMAQSAGRRTPNLTPEEFVTSAGAYSTDARAQVKYLREVIGRLQDAVRQVKGKGGLAQKQRETYARINGARTQIDDTFENQIGREASSRGDIELVRNVDSDGRVFYTSATNGSVPNAPTEYQFSLGDDAMRFPNVSDWYNPLTRSTARRFREKPWRDFVRNLAPSEFIKFLLAEGGWMRDMPDGAWGFSQGAQGVFELFHATYRYHPERLPLLHDLAVQITFTPSAFKMEKDFEALFLARTWLLMESRAGLLIALPFDIAERLMVEMAPSMGLIPELVNSMFPGPHVTNAAVSRFRLPPPVERLRDAGSNFYAAPDPKWVKDSPFMGPKSVIHKLFKAGDSSFAKYARVASAALTQAVLTHGQYLSAKIYRAQLLENGLHRAIMREVVKGKKGVSALDDSPFIKKLYDKYVEIVAQKRPNYVSRLAEDNKASLARLIREQGPDSADVDYARELVARDALNTGVLSFDDFLKQIKAMYLQGEVSGFGRKYKDNTGELMFVDYGRIGEFVASDGQPQTPLRQAFETLYGKGSVALSSPGGEIAMFLTHIYAYQNDYIAGRFVARANRFVNRMATFSMEREASQFVREMFAEQYTAFLRLSTAAVQKAESDVAGKVKSRLVDGQLVHSPMTDALSVAKEILEKTPEGQFWVRVGQPITPEQLAASWKDIPAAASAEGTMTRVRLSTAGEEKHFSERTMDVVSDPDSLGRSDFVDEVSEMEARNEELGLASRDEVSDNLARSGLTELLTENEAVLKKVMLKKPDHYMSKAAFARYRKLTHMSKQEFNDVAGVLRDLTRMMQYGPLNSVFQKDVRRIYSEIWNALPKGTREIYVKSMGVESQNAIRDIIDQRRLAFEDIHQSYNSSGEIRRELDAISTGSTPTAPKIDKTPGNIGGRPRDAKGGPDSVAQGIGPRETPLVLSAKDIPEGLTRKPGSMAARVEEVAAREVADVAPAAPAAPEKGDFSTMSKKDKAEAIRSAAGDALKALEEANPGMFEYDVRPNGSIEIKPLTGPGIQREKVVGGVKTPHPTKPGISVTVGGERVSYLDRGAILLVPAELVADGATPGSMADLMARTLDGLTETREVVDAAGKSEFFSDGARVFPTGAKRPGAAPVEQVGTRPVDPDLINTVIDAVDKQFSGLDRKFAHSWSSWRFAGSEGQFRWRGDGLPQERIREIMTWVDDQIVEAEKPFLTDPQKAAIAAREAEIAAASDFGKNLPADVRHEMAVRDVERRPAAEPERVVGPSGFTPEEMARYRREKAKSTEFEERSSWEYDELDVAAPKKTERWEGFTEEEQAAREAELEDMANAGGDTYSEQADIEWPEYEDVVHEPPPPPPPVKFAFNGKVVFEWASRGFSDAQKALYPDNPSMVMARLQGLYYGLREAGDAYKGRIMERPDILYFSRGPADGIVALQKDGWDWRLPASMTGGGGEVDRFSLSVRGEPGVFDFLDEMIRQENGGMYYKSVPPGDWATRHDTITIYFRRELTDADIGNYERALEKYSFEPTVAQPGHGPSWLKRNVEPKTAAVNVLLDRWEAVVPGMRERILDSIFIKNRKGELVTSAGQFYAMESGLDELIAYAEVPPAAAPPPRAPDPVDGPPPPDPIPAPEPDAHGEISMVDDSEAAYEARRLETLMRLSGKTDRQFFLEYIAELRAARRKLKFDTPEYDALSAEMRRAQEILHNIRRIVGAKKNIRTSPAHERRLHAAATVREFGGEADVMFPERMAAYYAENLDQVKVEVARAVHRKIRTAKVVGTGKRRKFWDSFDVSRWTELNRRMSDAIAEANGGFRASAISDRPDKSNRPPKDALIPKWTDKEARVLAAKKRVLAEWKAEFGESIRIWQYDLIRGVLEPAVAPGRRAALLIRRGADTPEKYLAARTVLAKQEAKKTLWRTAFNNPNMSPAEVYQKFLDDFTDSGELRFKEQVVTAYQQEVLKRYFEHLTGAKYDDELAASQALMAHGTRPPFDARYDFKAHQVHTGAWSPRSRDLVDSGKAAWSYDDQKEFFMANYRALPDWLTDPAIEDGSAFRDHRLYMQRLKKNGTFSNEAMVSARLTKSDTAQTAHTYAHGDPAKGIEPRRDLADQRRLASQTWGHRVVDANGRFISMPWLMTPSELADYAKANVKDGFGTLIHREKEVADLQAAIGRVIDRKYPKFLEAVSSGGATPVHYSDIIEFAYEVSQELMRTKSWKSFWRRDLIARGLDVWNLAWRAQVMTQVGFLTSNLVDNPTKGGVFSFFRRDIMEFGSERGAKAIEYLENIGQGEYTTLMYAGNRRGLKQRIADAREIGELGPGARDVADGALNTLVNALPTLAGNVENAVKLKMARDLYGGMWNKFRHTVLKDMDDELADLAIKTEVSRQLDSIFPTMKNAGPIERLLNQISPFLSYNVKNQFIWIREAANHPALLMRIAQAQRYLEKYNLEKWREEHDGEDPPAGAGWDRLKLQFPLGEIFGEPFWLDLGIFSDAGRGLKLLYAGDKTLADHLYGVFRPFSAMQISTFREIANGLGIDIEGVTTEYKWFPVLDSDGNPSGQYERRKVAIGTEWGTDHLTWGDIFWPAPIVGALIDAVNGKKVEPKAIIQMVSRMAFFKEFGTLDHYGMLNQQYQTLREIDPDAAEKFLLTPEGIKLKEYWHARGMFPKSHYLDPLLFQDLKNLDPKVARSAFIATQGPDFMKRVKEGYSALRTMEDYYDVKMKSVPYGSPEWKRMKMERKAAALSIYRDYPELIDYESVGISDADWNAKKSRWQTDSDEDTFYKLFGEWPKREDYKTDEAYQKARKEFKAARAEYLKAFPQVAARQIGSTDALRRAEYRVRQSWDAALDRITRRNKRIKALQEAGKYEQAGRLYDLNELDRLVLEREGIAIIFDKKTTGAIGGSLFSRTAARIGIVRDFEDQRVAAMDPVERKNYRKEQKYQDRMRLVRKKAEATGDFGSAFYRIMRNNPDLREQWFDHTPGKREQWAQNEAYMDFWDRFHRLANAGRWDAAWDRFDAAPAWIRERYYAKNPDARREHEQGSKYFAYMQRWGQLLDGNDLQKAFDYFDSLPEWVRDRYLEAHPESKMGQGGGGSGKKWVDYGPSTGGPSLSDAQFSQYTKMMGKWVNLLKTKGKAEANDYFRSMPQWAQDFYAARHPDKALLRESDAQLRKMAMFFLADEAHQNQMLQDDPSILSWLNENASGTQRINAIMYLYQSLPDDAWMKRTFREKYPEVFSPEAKGERAIQSVLDKLAENPRLQPAFLVALKTLWDEVAEAQKHQLAPPRQMEVERKKRRRLSHRHRSAKEVSEMASLSPRELS